MLDYFRAEGLNSTLLGNFAIDPCYAVKSIGNKTYFQDGKAFEDLFEQTILNNGKFDGKFFVSDVSVPDSIMEVWSDREDKEKTRRILADSYVYNKPKELTKKQIAEGAEPNKPELNGTKKSFHDCLDAILENDCKYPVNAESFDNMKLCVERLLSTKIEALGEMYYLGDLLKEKTFFQYPIYWEYCGIKKKALLDILVTLDDVAIHFDLKYMANLSAFNSSFRNVNDRYVIQSMHYTEGCQKEFGYDKSINQMIFLVATKSDPYLVQPFMIDDQSIEYCISNYNDLCARCNDWINSGRIVTGVKETKYNKIWG